MMLSGAYLLCAAVLLWLCLNSLNRMSPDTRWTIRIGCVSLAIGSFAAMAAVVFGWQPTWFNLLLVFGMDAKLLADARNRPRYAYPGLDAQTTLTG